MKKAVFAAIVVLIGVLLLNFRPMDLRKQVESVIRDEVEIIFCETEHLGETKYINKSWRYTLDADSKEVQDLLEIIGETSYRRSSQQIGIPFGYYQAAAGLIDVCSIRIENIIIGNDSSCIIGETAYVIGYGKNESEELLNGLKQLIFSWKKNHLYREVRFDGDNRLSDHEQFFYIE